MFQSAGVLLSVSFGDRPYGDPYFHAAFPNHDLGAVQCSLGFFARRRITKHKGWINACLLREQKPTGQNPYVHVGRALCPFALPGAAVCLVEPKMHRASLFSEEHGQLLRDGDVQRIFPHL